MMNLSLEAQRMMKRDGLSTNPGQELRTLLVWHFNKDYLVVIIDAKDGYWYAGFFELILVPSRIIIGAATHKGKWVGYCKGGLINDKDDKNRPVKKKSKVGIS